MAEHPLEDLFARLDRERRQAERLYNDALTAVDRALGQTPLFPELPQRYDEEQIAPLNRTWVILPDGAPPLDRSIKGRLRGFIWRLVGPALEAQQRFNGTLVDHINRNVAARRNGENAVVSLIDIVRRKFDALARFESLLVQFLQTITVYVDTKDRSLGGSDMRERLAMAEQRILALKRQIEQSPANPVQTTAAIEGRRMDPFGGAIDSLTYVGFEDRFRGSQEDIRSRVRDYLPILASASDVVDVGCGRGELLDLLAQQGVSARGVDMNQAMVELCRARGLDVEVSDALAFLERQRDGSIGGLVAIQVVEHMQPAYLLRFLETASSKMSAGAPLILETINPACWTAFFDCYIRDLTHERPLHPDTLRYLVQASGFTSIEVQYRAEVREGDRLDRVSPPEGGPAQLADVVAALNAHADKLNARLFSSMDYAIVARR